MDKDDASRPFFAIEGGAHEAKVLDDAGSKGWYFV